jgi:hypothetical protein
MQPWLKENSIGTKTGDTPSPRNAVFDKTNYKERYGVNMPDVADIFQKYPDRLARMFKGFKSKYTTDVAVRNRFAGKIGDSGFKYGPEYGVFAGKNRGFPFGYAPNGEEFELAKYFNFEKGTFTDLPKEMMVPAKNSHEHFTENMVGSIKERNSLTPPSKGWFEDLFGAKKTTPEAPNTPPASP